MQIKLLSLIVAISLVGVDAGFLCDPLPRRVLPDFIEALPQPFHSLDSESFYRTSLEDMGKMMDGQSGPEGLSHLPCGGVPSDESTAKTVLPGSSVNVGWQKTANCDATCTITLMCPGTAEDQVLWSGPCGDGRTGRDVTIPGDTKSASFGTCFIQWKMETALGGTHVGCVDVIVVQSPRSIAGPAMEGEAVASTCTSTVADLSPATITETTTIERTCTVTSLVQSPPETVTSTVVQEVSAAPVTLPPMTTTITETATENFTVTNVETSTITSIETSPVTIFNTVTMTETLTAPPNTVTLTEIQTSLLTLTETASDNGSLKDTPTSVPAYQVAATVSDFEKKMPQSEAEIELAPTPTVVDVPLPILPTESPVTMVSPQPPIPSEMPVASPVPIPTAAYNSCSTSSTSTATWQY